MTQQVPIDPAHVTGTAAEDGTVAVADDLAYARLAIVNVAFFGRPGAAGWVLIDAGPPGGTSTIRDRAAARFGAAARPAAILMTHAHFDHVGALETLAAEWDVPVFAHTLEHPYLDGSAAYPPPDPTFAGGAVATLSPLYGRGPVDVGARLQALPDDGSVPFMPGWLWLATPGHSIGHVSFWHPETRTLVAGDAVVTVAQESVYAVATQAPELHGPPRYFTHDWEAAAASARLLASLAPETLLTGHGRPLAGAAMRQALDTLARDFERIAVPAHGRYVDAPQRAADGGAWRKP